MSDCLDHAWRYDLGFAQCETCGVGIVWKEDESIADALGRAYKRILELEAEVYHIKYSAPTSYK